MKSAFVIVTYSLAAYGVMFSMAALFWWAYPYPENATQDQIYTVWSVHVLTEKFISYALTAILAAVVTLNLRNRVGKVSIIYGVLAGLSYHVIGGAIYMARFGIKPYIDNSKPIMLFGLVFALCVGVSFAIYKYMPNKPSEPTR